MKRRETVDTLRRTGTRGWFAPLAATGIVMAAVGARPAFAQANANAAAAQAPAAVEVRVNGQLLQFQGQPPVEQNGHLLVPLRGILERLGAYVDFDAASQTVVAFRNTTRITLPINSPQAQVNGRPVTLDVPAQIVNGSTMVPLRFVAQSLGAEVNFDVNTNTVSIAMVSAPPPPPTPVQVFDPQADARRRADEAHRADAHRDDDARRRAAAQAEAKRRADDRQRALDAERKRLETQKAIVGIVVSIFADQNPRQIVIHLPPGSVAPEGNQTIPLRQDARIAVQLPGNPDAPIPLDRLAPGDLVSVLQNGDGDGTAINLLPPPPEHFGAPPLPHPPLPPVSALFKGVFSGYARRDRGVIRLRMLDGHEIDVPHDVPVFIDSERIGVSDLRSGDKLTIAVDPHSHQGTRILVHN